MSIQLLQRTGHANDGASCFSVVSRVIRPLSWVDYEAVGLSSRGPTFFASEFLRGTERG
jgi:hypothetical protein